MINQIIIQGIGVLALILFFCSFQAKSRKNILYFHLLSSAVFAIHFGLLSAWTAVAMVSLNGVKSYVFTLKKEFKWARSNVTLYLFLVLFWVFGLAVWEGYHSIFVIIALNFVVISHWSNNTRKLRWLFMFSHPLWIIYDFMVGSYAGIFSEIVIFFSGAIGLWRFERKPRVKDK